MMASDIEGIDFYDLISIQAELEAFPEALPRILQDHDIRDAQALADIERRWMERIEADLDLRRSYELFYDHHHAQFAEEVRRKAEQRAAVAPPEPPPVALDVLASELPPEPPSPILPGAPSDHLRSTAPTLDLPRGPELPFTQGVAPSSGSASRVAVPRPAESLTGTAPTLNIPRGPVLPFVERPAGEPQPEVPPQTASAIPSAPGIPTGTGPSLDIPRRPALPFEAGSSAAPPTSPGTPRAPSPLAETSLSLGLPRDLMRTLAGRPPAASTGPTAAPATPPDQGSALPTLSLEQHASLHVELALWPDQVDATLERYQLTREVKALLDAQLGERIARSSALREAWDQACRTYQAWVMARQGSR